MELALSDVITKIKKIWARLSSKEYRDEFVSATISDRLAAQIFSMREQKGWTQAELAATCGMMQPRISKLEESCEGVSVTTLRKIASAFDVGLSIKFVPFSEVVGEASRVRLDKTVLAFSQDSVSAQNVISIVSPMTPLPGEASQLTSIRFNTPKSTYESRLSEPERK